MNNILTQVNSFTPSFKDLVECRNIKPKIDINQLEKFVRFIHGNSADITKNEVIVTAYTKNHGFQFIYHCFGQIIFRTEKNTGKKKAYTIL
jgi:hypothetical protein